MPDSNSVGNASVSPQAPPLGGGPQNGSQAADSSSPTASTDPGLISAPAARWARLPAELRERRQWVVAGADKSPRKINGMRASPTDPNTWTDFASAAAAAEADGLGIGYMLHEADPFTCIDLDVKDDTTPEQHARFQSIVKHFDSYTEHSRSGKGLHVWVRGKIGSGKRRDGVEVYSQERFIICTGNAIGDQAGYFGPS